MNNRRNELIIASAKKYCKCTVQGKTIRVNQQVTNGNFANTNDWNIRGTTAFSVNNNEATIVFTTFENYECIYQNVPIKEHKYILYCECYSVEANTIVFQFNANWQTLRVELQSNERKPMCYIYEGVNSNANELAIYTNDIGTIKLKNCMLIDLTELGLDNISSVSDFYQTDIGKLVRKGVYLETSYGAFIHANTPINFIGRNIWDEQWENCYYHEGQNGQKVEYNGTVGCANQIKVYPNTTYCFSTNTPYYFYVLFYDENGDYLSDYVYNYGTKAFTTPINCHYITFYIANATYNHDICISESIWNENWEIGNYNADGTKGTQTDCIRAKNSINATPNTQYYMHLNGYNAWVCFYDKNGAFISGVTQSGNGTITTPNNCEFIAFSMWSNYGITYKNDIGIFNTKYQPYCGVSTFRNGFRLIKGDKYKSWTLSDIWYNNYCKNGNFEDNTAWSLYSNTYASLSIANNKATVTITTGGGANYTNGLKQTTTINANHKYFVTCNFKNGNVATRIKFEMNSNEGVLTSFNANEQKTINALIEIGNTIYENAFLIFPFDTNAVGYSYEISNVMVIDLTQLGLDNITSVEEFLNTSLGVYIQNYGYLPYTTTNETTTEQKDQLVRTMALVDLESDLTWYVDTQLTNKVVWYSDEYIQDDFNVKIPESRYDTFNGLNEKGRIISYEDMSQGNCEVGDIAIDSYGTVYFVTSSDQVEPTGNLLLELTTPQNITSYRVIIAGHQVLKSVDSQLVARNTIKVESANNVELDFTKE